MSTLSSDRYIDLQPQFRRKSRKRLANLIVVDSFALSYLVVFGLTYHAGPSHNQTSFLGLGLLLGLLCVYTFFYAGAFRILFSSIISYGHLLFVATPAVLIGTGQDSLYSGLRSSVALLYLSIFFCIQILVLLCSHPNPTLPSKLGEVNGSFQIIALSFIAMSFIATYVRDGSILVAIFAPLYLVGLIMSALVLLTRASFSSMIFHLMILSSLIAIYSLYQFNGFGRIVAASYFLSLVIVASWLKPSYVPKVIVLSVTVPGMIILSLARVSLVEQRQNRSIGLDESLGSAFGPFQSGSIILQASIDGVIDPTYGLSHWASFLFWVPRSIWPNKPIGFGRAIVPVTQPHLISSPQHSDAASYPAEFVWDFGIPGLLICLVVVFIVATADRMFVANESLLKLDRIDSRLLLEVTTWACLISMLLSYVWGGTFPYVSRIAPAVGIVLVTRWLLNRENRAPSTATSNGKPSRKYRSPKAVPEA